MNKTLKQTLLKIENIFLIFWLVTGSLIAVFAAPTVGKDEMMHIARAEQIAEGQLLPLQIDNSKIDTLFSGEASYNNPECPLYGGNTDEAIYHALELHKTWQDYQYSFPWWTDSKCSNLGQMHEGSVTWAFSNASINSPLCYLPYSLGYLFACIFSTSPVVAIIFMRLFGVVAFGLIVRYAIKIAPIGKNIIFLVAGLPISISTNAAVGADALTTACSILFVSYVLLFIFRKDSITNKEFIGLGITLCCLSLLKRPYIALGLLLFLIFFLNKVWQKKDEDQVTYATKSIPSYLIICSVIYVLLVEAACAPHVSKKHRVVGVVFLIVGLFIVFLTVVGLYLTYTPAVASKVEGYQSRYILPVLFPLFMCFVFFCSKKHNVQGRGRTTSKNEAPVRPSVNKNALRMSVNQSEAGYNTQFVTSQRLQKPLQGAQKAKAGINKMPNEMTNKKSHAQFNTSKYMIFFAIFQFCLMTYAFSYWTPF